MSNFSVSEHRVYGTPHWMVMSDESIVTSFPSKQDAEHCAAYLNRMPETIRSAIESAAEEVTASDLLQSISDPQE